MKNLIFLLSLLFVLTNCKKDDPESQANMANIAGQWQLEAYETTQNGKKTWSPAEPTQPQLLTFRADGVILDNSGLPLCCSPTSLKINGALFEVKPALPLEPNPLCALVNCAFCATWEIQQQGNEIIIEGCNTSTRTKYVKK
jgi:hypothetical protein